VPDACTIRVQHDVVHVWMCVCVWLVVLCAWWCGCCFVQQKAFITLCSPVVPLLSTSKADSGLASEFRRDRAIYTAYERMLKAQHQTQAYMPNAQTAPTSRSSGPETGGQWGSHAHAHTARCIQKQERRQVTALRLMPAHAEFLETNMNLIHCSSQHWPACLVLVRLVCSMM
jgi:hypothetical protein